MTEAQLYYGGKLAGKRDADRLHAACVLGAALLVCALALGFAAGWRAAKVPSLTIETLAAEEVRP